MKQLKSFFLLVIFFMLREGFCFGQSDQIKFICYYGEGSNPDLACMRMQRSFTSSQEAENAVNKILRPLGLAPNFVMVSCNNINNCAALTLADGFRYIVYDGNFMQSLGAASGSKWTNLSILAHEIGHHLQGHTLRGGTLADCRKMELEADRFSGFVLQKLGASLSDAQAAMNALPHPLDDTYSDHPSKIKRLDAIRSGYLDASGATVIVPSEKVEKSKSSNLSINDIIRSPDKLILKDSWEKGFNCRKICFGDGQYFAFMLKNYGSWQHYKTNLSFPVETIAEDWKKSPGTIITNIDYINGAWNLVMTDLGKEAINQTYIRKNYFPTQEINDKWNENYKITDAAYGNGEWIIVMNKPDNFASMTKQMYNSYTDFPTNDIREYWNKNYYITLLEYLNGKWFLVMSQYSDRNPSNFNQRWNTNSNFPMDQVIANDGEGYNFISVSYGQGIWVTVMNNKFK